MHIGIDFDGTIVTYGSVFHRHAAAQFGMPPEVAPDKNAIRAYFWARSRGREEWIELQGLVYGLKMEEAELASGVDDFLAACRNHRVPVSVISHKTEFAAGGPRVNLRESARRWMEDRRFFGPGGLGLDPRRVFFESTRDAKINRIVSASCTHFIDDLIEVFQEPSFPAAVTRILYGGAFTEDRTGAGIHVCAHWRDIRRLLFPGVA